MNTPTTQAGAPDAGRVRSKWIRSAKVRPAVLLWALGVPIPFIVIFLLIRGCM